MNFSNGNSNYELNFLEKPNFIHYPEGLLKEKAFSNDTLKVALPTNGGIQKLVIQIKDVVTKSTMNLTITNMTYDNDYFIDVGNYESGNYIFNWKNIDKCHSINKDRKLVVDCEGMEFEQLLLTSEKSMIGSFNHNKIKITDVNSFAYVKGKIFKTWSNVFTINGIKCYWEYEVKYTNQKNENSKEILVNLVSQKLLAWETKDLLLDLDLSKFVYLPPKSISELEYNRYPDSSLDNLKDVNSDNNTDIQFMTEHAGAGANIAYATYLFNSTNNKFEYSEIFNDYNIKYDPDKNRISSFMKSRVDNYYYQFKNLKENRKDVDFIENIHHSADTIFYKKIVDEKVVKEKKIVLGEYENWKKYLERK